MVVEGIMEHKYDTDWECEGHKVIECHSCGFKHIFPIPSQDDLAGFYTEKYYRDVKPVSYKNMNNEDVKKTKQLARDDKFYRIVYDKIIELKRNDSLGMLDIGCGNDLLSFFFKTQGWNESIIEPNIDAGEYLKSFGLNVLNHSVEDSDLSTMHGISFINMQFVLEHITNPLEILQKAYQLLTPGGIIRVCVPNDFSEGQLAYMEHFKEKPRWVCLPDHINYFNFNSLNQILMKAGFKEVYRTTDFPMELLLMSGMNYYASEEEQQKVGPFIINFENSLAHTGRRETLQVLYESLAKVGFGRRIYMYAMKPI